MFVGFHRAAAGVGDLSIIQIIYFAQADDGVDSAELTPKQPPHLLKRATLNVVNLMCCKQNLASGSFRVFYKVITKSTHFYYRVWIL